MNQTNDNEQPRADESAIDSGVVAGSDVVCRPLVCDIRAAVGDPNGRLTQGELVARIEKLRELAEYIANENRPAWKSGGRGVAIAKDTNAFANHASFPNQTGLNVRSAETNLTTSTETCSQAALQNETWAAPSAVTVATGWYNVEMKSDKPMTAKEAYIEDVRRCPEYHDGSKRRSWNELDCIAKMSWRRNPTPRTYKTVASTV